MLPPTASNASRPAPAIAASSLIVKPCIIAVFCMASLAACGKRAVPDAVFSKSSDPQRTGMTALDSCSPLPAKVVLGFPYRLQADFYYSDARQAIRRRVVLQYLGTDTATLTPLVNQAMLKAGFALRDSRPEGNGGTHLHFSLKGYGTANVIVQPYAGVADGATVKGTLSFDLPPPQFNPPPGAGKSTASVMAN